MASYVGIARAIRYVVVVVLLGSTCLVGGSGSRAQASALAVPLSPLASVSACGTVTAYTPATVVTAGSITIGGQTLAIAKGAVLTGVAVLLGSNLCLSAQLNASGQIQSGTFNVNVGASISVCGSVTAYAAAGALTTGLLTIGGQALVLAPGATLSGAPISVGANLCVQASTNGLGQVTGGTVSANTQTTVTVCGTVTSYTAATASAPGSITISGQTFTIARGTTLSGGPITIGANVSATFTLDSTGTVVGGSVSLGGCATNTSVPSATNTVAPTATNTFAATATSTDVATATSTETASSPTATSTDGATPGTPSTTPTGGATVAATTGTGNGNAVTASPARTPTSGSPAATSTSGGGSGATATPTETGTGNRSTPVPPTAGPQATATTGPSSTGGNGSSSTPTLTEYSLPGTVSGTQRGRGPWQFARDRHGNIWFTEYLAGGLGEILAGTHTLHEYRLHGPHTYPMGIAADHAGRIWVVERAGNRIDRLVLRRGHATLTSWQLPHVYSGPQEVALGTHGGLWITERASRVALFNPGARRLSEYSLNRGLQPYGITVNSHGPTFVNENANLQSWATVTSSGRLQLRVKGLPWQGSDPTLVAPTSSSSYVAMPMADGFARLRQPARISLTLRPSMVTLKAVSQPRALASTRLTPFDSGVKVVTRTARRTSHNGSVLWRLPPHPGRPFDVKVDPRGKQVWLSEQRVSIVAATTFKNHQITDYVMSRKNAGLRGILVTKQSTGARVWIAEFYANRIGLLDTP